MLYEVNLNFAALNAKFRLISEFGKRVKTVKCASGNSVSMAMASESKEITQTFQSPHTGAGNLPDILSFSDNILILTWVAFAIMMILLYKFAWKPILAGLDRREEEIRKAVENAAKLKKELSGIETERAQAMSEADGKAREIIEKARKAAIETANVTEKKAHEKIVILQENAEREIKAAHEKAVTSLKKDIAEIAVTMAGKVIMENINEKEQAKLTDKLIREM